MPTPEPVLMARDWECAAWLGLDDGPSPGALGDGRKACVRSGSSVKDVPVRVVNKSLLN